MAGTPPSTYEGAGVNTAREEHGLARLTQEIQRTWPRAGFGAVQLPIGYFANVIDLGGTGLAISADGVGSKVLIAQMTGNFDTVGIDCVAMNVNDLLCVGAKPVSMVDYIAVQQADPEMLAGIARGLRRGAELANISIPGGEIAQLPDILAGHKTGLGFDLAGMAVGTVPLDRILVGRHVEPGDVIIGIESNGIHSNGLTLARRVFFEQNNFTVESRLPELDCTLGEELLKPTHIYVREAVEMLERDLPVKAFIHITSDGFLNLARVEAEVGFVIDSLPPIPPIFSAIQTHGNITDEEMFWVYNMGTGFCVVAPAAAAEDMLACVRSHGKRAYLIGHVVADADRRVFIQQKGLVGKEDHFAREVA
jgi:phosphoribosylformylglycinamidine cyclo-ligase